MSAETTPQGEAGHEGPRIMTSESFTRSMLESPYTKMLKGAKKIRVSGVNITLDPEYHYLVELTNFPVADGKVAAIMETAFKELMPVNKGLRGYIELLLPKRNKKLKEYSQQLGNLLEPLNPPLSPEREEKQKQIISRAFYLTFVILATYGKRLVRNNTEDNDFYHNPVLRVFPNLRRDLEYLVGGRSYDLMCLFEDMAERFNAFYKQLA